MKLSVALRDAQPEQPLVHAPHARAISMLPVWSQKPTGCHAVFGVLAFPSGRFADSVGPPCPQRLGDIGLNERLHDLNARRLLLSPTTDRRSLSGAHTMNTPLVAKSPAALPDADFELRRATLDDVAELLALHRAALLSLSHGHYSTEQVESFIEHVPTLDTQLIRQGRYFVVCTRGRLIACGGWSADPPGYESAIDFGVDSSASHDDGAAMIRAMYTDPTWARRGLGRRILRLAEFEALGAGYNQLRLDALLPGVPLYRACHYEALNQSVGMLPDGQSLAVMHMRKVSVCGIAQQTDLGIGGRVEMPGSAAHQMSRPDPTGHARAD